MTALPPFFEAVTRFKYLGGSRPTYLGKPVPHITAQAHPEVLDQWRQFDLWRAWKDANGYLHGGPPRPNVWETVPRWAWDILIELRAPGKAKLPVQHDKPPASTPPPPLTVTLPIAFTAYGYRNGEFHDGNDVQRLQAGGFRSVALQQGEGATLADVDRLKDAGFHEIYAWDDLAFDAARTRAWLASMEIPEQNYIPQVESPAQLDRLRQYLAAGFDIRAAVVSGSQPIPADIAAKVTTALVECYAHEGYPFSDLDRMCAQFVRDGWPNAVPVLGIYDGATVADHTNARGHWPNGGVWLLETCEPAQLAALKAMT